MATVNAAMNSKELSALATVFPICCNDQYSSFTETKQKKVSLKKGTKARDEIEACVYKTLGGVNEKCKEQFEDAMVCLAKYPKQWSKCTQIRAKLEECAVANKLGDISKM